MDSIKLPTKIISGGQTGADRAAGDFALDNGIDYGGWVPKGRKAEDGQISDKYSGLKETPTSQYGERTRLNIMDSDATLICSHGPLNGGSKLTQEYAVENSKKCLHIDFLKQPLAEAAQTVKRWLSANELATLNIAGPRDSEDALIYSKTKDLLTLVFD